MIQANANYRGFGNRVNDEDLNYDRQQAVRELQIVVHNYGRKGEIFHVAVPPPFAQWNATSLDQLCFLHMRQDQLEPLFQPLVLQWGEDLVLRQNNKGHTLLHTAVTMVYYGRVDRLLATPQSVPIRNHKGATAVHLACENKDTQSLEDMLAALEGHPEAVKETLLAEDQDGNLPLHHMCQERDMDPERIRNLVNLCPEALHHRNRDGDTPVELALRSQPEDGVAENPVWSEVWLQMVQVSPPSVLSIERDMASEGTNPLHRMCEMDAANLELLQFARESLPGRSGTCGATGRGTG